MLGEEQFSETGDFSWSDVPEFSRVMVSKTDFYERVIAALAGE